MYKKNTLVDPEGQAYLTALYRLAKTGRSVKKRLQFLEFRIGGGKEVRVSHADTPANELCFLEISEVNKVTDYCP